MILLTHALLHAARGKALVFRTQTIAGQSAARQRLIRAQSTTTKTQKITGPVLVIDATNVACYAARDRRADIAATVEYLTKLARNGGCAQPSAADLEVLAMSVAVDLKPAFGVWLRFLQTATACRHAFCVFDNKAGKGASVRQASVDTYLSSRRRRQQHQQQQKRGGSAAVRVGTETAAAPDAADAAAARRPSFLSHGANTRLAAAAAAAGCTPLTTDPGYEADDLIGAVVGILQQAGAQEVVIVSGDGDMRSLLADNVSWLQVQPLISRAHPSGEAFALKCAKRSRVERVSMDAMHLKQPCSAVMCRLELATCSSTGLVLFIRLFQQSKRIQRLSPLIILVRVREIAGTLLHTAETFRSEFGMEPSAYADFLAIAGSALVIFPIHCQTNVKSAPESRTHCSASHNQPVQLLCCYVSA